MRSDWPDPPEAALRRVTEEIVRRAVRMGRRKGRTITISKTSRGQGVPVAELDPSTPEGRQRLDAFLAGTARHYTISGLGAPEEKNAIDWRALNAGLWRRCKWMLMVGVSFVLKGNPFKNRFYRWMGMHIGRNVEIMQMVWLDHFRPELIYIGDNTLIGAFSQFTVHAYEGCGRFRFGLVEVGRNCTIGAGAGLGIIKVEDNVRILPGTTASPYYPRIKAGTVVGYAPPPKTAAPAGEASEPESERRTSNIEH
jgi:acetyltransferase-like isoleucine patch superfamily enzyme